MTAPDSPPSGHTRSWLLLSLGVFTVLVAIAAIAWYVLLRPWIVMPDEPPEEIAAGWAHVVALAAPSTEGPLGELPAAVEAVRGLPPEATERLQGQDQVPVIDPATLPLDAVRALDLLEGWQAAAGGLGDATCPDVNALALYRLGQLALATSDARPYGLEAALHLAHAATEQGGALLASVGFQLARGALDRVRALPDEERARLVARYAPSRDLLKVAAREWVCAHELAETQLARELEESGEVTGPVDEHPVVVRELRMVELYAGTRIREAEAARGDLDALARALELGDPEELPKSALLRTLAIDLGEHARKWTEVVEAWQALR